MTFDYGAIDIAVQRILSVMDPAKVILFGSAARGEASEDSDMDLLIVSETDDTVEEAIRARLAIGVVGVPVDILVYTPGEFSELSGNRHSVVHNAIEEGKVLHDGS